jgi:hypothetical protein
MARGWVRSLSLSDPAAGKPKAGSSPLCFSRRSPGLRFVARLAESLGVLQETGNPLYMHLELLAAAVSMRGDHRRAALLFGAAEALREAVGAFVLPL